MFGADDTVERRSGRKITAKGCYRDAVRSTKKHVIRCFGVKWVSMMLLVPVPWSRRVWALPFLTVLCWPPKSRHKRRHKSSVDGVRQMMKQVRRWLPQRLLVLGMIVMAAAGNYVQIVVAPASYDNCLAVAATGPGDIPWVDSSRGTAVDVSMPGACVYVATYENMNPIVRAGNGTSFAVAHLAAAAALWLAHHGRQSLINKYGIKRIQAAFLTTLRWPGVCIVPPGWDPDYGVGRVDLLGLLNAPLPRPQDLVQVAAFGTAEDDAVSRIAAMISADPVRVRIRLAELLKVANHDELDQTIAEHEGELVYLVLADRAFAVSLAQPGAVGAFPPKINVAGVTTDLGLRLTA